MRKFKLGALVLGAALVFGAAGCSAFGESRAVEVGAANVTDIIVASDLVATNTTYKDFSGVNKPSGAVYAGNNGQTASGGIQLRSKNSNSGIVSTTSGGTLKSVSIVVESGSNTVDVYGSNSAYAAASDLYNSSSQGTKVGSTSTTGTITVTGSYEYVGIRSNNGALYLTSVSIVWDDGQGGEETEYTITYNANGGSGEMSDSVSTNPTVAACTFTAPTDKIFSSWNTEADGSGDEYVVGATPGADLDLYAIWVDKPSAVTLDKIGVNAAAAYSEELATVDIVDGDDTYTLNYVNAKKQNDAMIMQKSSGAFISNHTEMPGDINSVELYINSGASASATYDVAFGTTEFTTATAGIGAESIAGGGNHSYENSSVTGARYFCVTLGAAYNGQVLKIVVNYVKGSSAELTSISVTGNMEKTSYTTAEAWDSTGLVVTAHYDDESSKTVSGATWTYNPENPSVGVTSVIATATYQGKSASSSAQVVTVTRANPIQAIYTKSSGNSVDVYGYYVGFLDGTGPVIMDGEYGVVIFNSSADVSGYTAGTTILHVTGSVSIYKGLYEIGSATITVASGDYDAPETPVVYTSTGNETAEYASRLTTVTGTPTAVTQGSFDDAAGTNDIKMDFTVGAKTFTVFYKKAAQTADADAFAAIKDAVTNSSEITIKGFTGWYNGFQVQMNGYVPAAESYTAEEFAQDLLDQTDAICEDYDGETNNHDALVAIWNDLASNDKYPSLPSAQKTILAEAERDESGTVVEQAMARYDYLTGKYNLNNFIIGRNPIVPAGVVVANNTVTTQNTNMIAIIVILSVALVSSTGAVTAIIIKKRTSR